MDRRISKLTSLLLAIAMLVSLMPSSVFAVTLSDTELEDLPVAVLDELTTAVFDENSAYAQYTFTPTEDGTYVFASYSDEDTWGCIYDTDGNRLVQDDDSGESYNFLMTYAMTAGTTYVLTCQSYNSESGQVDFKIYKAPELTGLAADPAELVGYKCNGFISSNQKVTISPVPSDAPMSDLTFYVEDTSVADIYYWYKGNSYCTIYFTGLGTTNLIAKSGDVTLSIPITVTAPPVIELDETVTVTSNNNTDIRVFAFTPEEDGDYSFCLSDASASTTVYVNNPNGARLFSSYGSYDRSTPVTLTGGSTYYYCTYSNYSSSASTYTVSVIKSPEVTSLTADPEQITEVYVDGVSDSVYVCLTAEPVGASLTDLIWTVGDESVASVYSSYNGENYCYVEIKGVGETTVTATCGDVSVSIPVTVTAPTTLLQDETVTLTSVGYTDTQILAFTPAESGEYTFSLSGATSATSWWLWNQTSETLFSSSYEYNTSQVVSLEAGVTYYLYSRATYRYSTSTYDILVSKTPALTGITSETTQIQCTYVGDNTSWQYVTVSAEPALADLSDLVWSVEDTTVATVSDSYNGLNWCYVTFCGVGETNLVATCGDVSLRIPITVSAPTVLNLAETVTVTSGNYWDKVIFTFTPTESGDYTFTFSNCTDGYRISLRDAAHTHYYFDASSYNDKGFFANLTAGETYYLYTSSCEDEEPATYDICVIKSPELEDLSVDLTEIKLWNLPWYTESRRVNVTPTPETAGLSSLTWTVEDTSVATVDSWYDGCDYCWVYYEGDGKTNLIVSAGDISLSIPIIARAPVAVALDEVTDVYSSLYDDYMWLAFTPTTTGGYCFRVQGCSGTFYAYLYDSDSYWLESTGWWDQEDGILFSEELTAGETYYLRLNSTSSDTAAACSVQITEAPAVESITLSRTAICDTYLEGVNASSYVCAYLSPEGTTATVQWSIANENVAVISSYGSDNSCYVQPVGAGETTLTAYVSDDVSVTIPVIITAPTEILLDESVTVTSENNEDERVFAFTPAETGDYAFCISDATGSTNMYLYDDNWDSHGVYWVYDDHFTVSLTGGRTYYLYTNASYYYSGSTYTVTVTEAPELTGFTANVSWISTYYVGDYQPSFYIALEAEPELACLDDVVWTVGDTSVATVDSWYDGQDHCYVSIKDVGETTLTATCGDISLTIPITVHKPQELELDTVISISSEGPNDQYACTITPEVSGDYTFILSDCTNSVEFALLNSDGESEFWYHTSGWTIGATLTAGETYYLYTYAEYMNTAATCSIQVVKAPELEAITSTTTAITATYTGYVFQEYVSVQAEPSLASLSDLVWTVGDTSVAMVDSWYNGQSYCYIRIKGAGETTLTATCGDISLTIPVTVTTPGTLELDTTVSATSQNYNDENVYAFTPEESGGYVFTLSDATASTTMNLLDADGSGLFYRGWYTSVSYSVNLTAGETYYLYTYASDYDMPSTYDICVSKAPELTGITSDTTQITACYTGLGYSDYYVSINAVPSAAPLGDLVWTVGDTSVATVSSGYNGQSYCYIRIKGAGETTLTATCGDISLTIPVTVTTPGTLELDTTVSATSQNYNDENVYAFTPEESGGYVFTLSDATASTTMYLLDADGSSLFYRGWYTSVSYSVNLTAGETYYLYTYASDYDTPSTYDICVSKAPELTGITSDTTQITACYTGFGYSEYYVSIDAVPSAASLGGVVWTVGDTSVVELEGDYDGYDYCWLYIVGVGETTLTAACGDISLTIPVTVTAPGTLTLGQATKVSSANWNDSRYYTFTPTESGSYTFYVSDLVGSGNCMYLYDSENDCLAQGYYYGASNYRDISAELTAGETYLIQVCSDYASATECSLTVIQSPAVTEITSSSSSLTITYLPGQNADYYVQFSVEPSHAALNSVKYRVKDTSVADCYGGTGYCYVCPVGVGSTVLELYTDDGVTLEIPIEISEPETVALVSGKTYTLNCVDGSTYMTFTPSETGEYIIYSRGDDCDPFVVLYQYVDGGWSYVNEADDSDGRNFELTYTLTGGTSYMYKVNYFSYNSDTSTTDVIFSKTGTLTGITVDTDPISDYVGATGTLDIEAVPRTEALSGVTVISTNTKVVTVSYDADEGSCTYTLVGSGDAQILVSWNGTTYSIDVEAKTIPTLTLDVPVSVTVSSSNSAYYTFTPDADGYYNFYLSDSSVQKYVYVYVYDADSKYLSEGYYYSTTENRDASAYLEAGVTYEVYVEYWYWTEMTCKLCVTESKQITGLTFGSDGTTTTVTGYAGGSSALKLNATPEHTALSSLTIRSTNTSVVTASLSGSYIYYELVSAGTEYILVSNGTRTWSVRVTVKAPLVLELDKTESITSADYADQTIYTFTPDKDGEYTFCLSDVTFGKHYGGAYASICDSDGDYVGGVWTESAVDADSIVTLSGGETYTVRVASSYSNSSASFSLTVVSTPEVTGFTADTTSISLTGLGGYGTGVTVKLTSIPAHGDLSEAQWSIADASVARVYGYSNGIGYVQAVNPGTTTLTITCGDTTVSIPVTVTEPETLSVNTTLTLSDSQRYYVITPSETATYTFASSGDTDPWISIYRIDGSSSYYYVGADDTDSSTGDYNYTLDAELQAGVKYLICLGLYGTDSYQVSITGPDSEESSVLYGDVNGDGKIEPADAALLLQYLASWKVEIVEKAADVNGDGKIEPADAALLLQYLASWKVTLGPDGN